MSDPAPEPDWKTPIRVEAREGFSIWVEFNDGVGGLVDLSDLADEHHYRRWQNREYFERVQIAPYGDLVWVEYETQISADEVYTRLTGLTEAEIYPELAEEIAAEAKQPQVKIPKPTCVEAREGYTIWVEFEDGVNGVIDLSEEMDKPVFGPLRDRAFFKSVRIVDGDHVAWSDDLDLCAEAMYADITGTTLYKLWGVSEPVPLDA